MAGVSEQLNVFTPDLPAALLIRAIAEYEIDAALNLIY